VSKIDTDAGVEKKLLQIVSKNIELSNIVEPYAAETTDQDDRVFSLNLSETDFANIAEQILAGTDAQRVEEIGEFNNAWATVIQINSKKNTLFAVRRVPESFNLRKLTNLFNVVFANRKLMQIDEDVVLRLDYKVDFFAFESEIFILNKKAFETGMNFRVGMERKRDDLLNDFETRRLFDNVKLLREKCGNNLHYLRKFSTIEKSGYYKDPNFMSQLEKVAKAEGWPLKFQGGQLVLTEDNLEIILTILGNNRVKSMVNEEKFDIEGVKKPI